MLLVCAAAIGPAADPTVLSPDFAQAGAPGAWHCYPPRSELSVRLADEECENRPALEFRLQKAAGHVDFPLPQNGLELKRFSFYAKALPDNSDPMLEVMLRDGDGERFFQTVKLTPDWKPYAFDAADLKIYTYGGARIADGRLSADKVAGFRFNNFPQGRHFLISRLKFEYAPVKQEKTAEKPLRPVVIKSIPETDFPVKRTDAFSGLRDFTIADGRFLRDGKPAFLLGGWQLDNEANPWLMRLFGVDVMTYNADEIYTLYPPRKTPDGKLELEWRENPYYEAFIRRFLNNRVRFWHEHKAHPRYSVLRNYPEFAELSGAGHFVAYNPHHPLGEAAYREMFKSWMRYTGKYPIFCYELFNEMGYRNLKSSARSCFRQAMRRKYGEIGKANAAWHTAFPDFDAVQPPGFLADGGRGDLPREALFAREGTQYPNLLIDWLKFQEDDCHEMVRKLMPVMRSCDSDRRTFSTLQSHLNLYLDYCDIGVKPETVHDFSDFYSHEAPMRFIESDGDSFRNIVDMAKTLLYSDIVRGISPDKPIVNAEAPLSVQTRGVPEDELTASDLAGLHGDWLFFDATRREPADWTSPRLDETNWKPVKVPGMWGASGFPGCQVGLYRRTFPATPEMRREKVYLNGSGFADSAELYLNGEKIGAVNGFATAFSLDLTGKLKETNVLAVKIVNRYFENGMYFGGIRGFASINFGRHVPAAQRAVDRRHFRSALWEQAAHGMNGVMVCYSGSFFTPAARVLPEVKAELENVADLLFDPADAVAPGIAMVWPQETFRGIVHRDYLQKISGPATSDLMPFYAGLLFNGYAPAVIRAADIRKGALPFRLLVMPDAIRVSGDVRRKLLDYVKAGGNLLVNYGSFAIEDEFHGKTDNRELTGVEETALSTGPGGRFLDGATGAEIRPAGAEFIRDGELARHRVGKGTVFYLPRRLSPERTAELLKFVAAESGVTPNIVLEKRNGSPPPRYVDRRLFRSGRGENLVYLLNYGRDCGALLRLPELPDGKYRLRNIAGPNPDESRILDAAELRKGVPLRLGQFDPAALLLEPESLPPRRLAGISPERLTMLDELWKAAGPVPGRKTVGLLPIPGMEQIHGTIPTARKLLTDHNFNVRELRPDEPLDGIDVLVCLSPRLEFADTAKILEFLRNGGGMLFCGGGGFNHHCTSKNEKLLRALGLAEGGLFSALYTSNAPMDEDNLIVHCTDFANHPLSGGVREMVTAGSNVLTKVPDSAAVVLRAPAGSNHPGAPLLAALEYGKGRFIYCADGWFLRPTYLERGDNARLWLNMIAYLAGESPGTASGETIARSLFLTRKRLETAERQEREGRFTFRAPENGKSYLDASGKVRIKVGGPDPIVDVLNHR